MTRRIILAHGFTQTGRTWREVEALLTDRFDVSAVDLPGHGAAGGLVTDLWGAADHLVDVGGPGTYVGYSMGGRIALHAALRRPDEVERLVLIGATAGIVDPTERSTRQTSDEQLAERIERIGVEAFVDEWLRLPLFAGLTDETAQRDDRVRNTAAGLASSLRTCGTGTQESLWDRLGEIRCPTLVIVGEHDTKFTELGRRLVEGLDAAQLRVIDDVGHCVHLEAPAATAQAIADFATN